MLRFSAHFLDNLEYKTLPYRYELWYVCVKRFLGKTEYKKTSFILQFNQFLGDEKSHSPNGRVICDLHSPDTFDTRLGERASANVQP